MRDKYIKTCLDWHRRNLALHSGMDGTTGCYRAAKVLNLSEEQVRRGLQYRSHVLQVMDK